MGKVHVLDQELINQIAAGEVIERPASVVKELLENAIDAKAGQIAVEIEGSGLDLIRLADDGSGMTAEELEMAVLRHATSKIASSDDLFSIRTLGFRGEALPSILSVSRSMLATKTTDFQAGSYLSLEGGSVIDKGMKGMPRGTVVEVRDLFFNTPARKKFLKTTSTEQRHIIDVVTRYALAYPSVKFTLSINGRNVLNLKGASLEERVLSIWGKEAAGKLHGIQEDKGHVKITGIAAAQDISRPGKTGIYTYVNRRSVLDHTLRAAVIEAYGGLIMRQRCPMAVLFIEIDPAEVDVNVHPAKAEVRFRNPSAMFGSLVNAVRKAVSIPLSYDMKQPETMSDSCRVSESMVPYPLNRPETGLPAKEKMITRLSSDVVQQSLFAERSSPRLTYSDKTVIGVLHATYVLLEDETSLYILDQHAAHERVTYERLKVSAPSEKPAVQELLTPLIMELSPAEFSAYEDIAQEITQTGIVTEVFGESAVAVRAVPQVLSHADVMAVILDLISCVMEGSLKNSCFKEDMLARIACHASVKAGKRLQASEITALLADLDRLGSPLTCPHGRPLFKRIGKEEIERWTGRRPF